jgi:hypothetical protein
VLVPTDENTLVDKVMLKKLYLIFGMGVLVLYASAAWFGWELANSGSRSRLGVPFIYTGFRGGK